jgi:hypothetical protein
MTALGRFVKANREQQAGGEGQAGLRRLKGREPARKREPRDAGVASDPGQADLLENATREFISDASRCSSDCSLRASAEPSRMASSSALPAASISPSRSALIR